MAELPELSEYELGLYHQFKDLLGQHPVSMAGNVRALPEDQIHFYLINNGYTPDEPFFQSSARYLRALSQEYQDIQNSKK